MVYHIEDTFDSADMIQSLFCISILVIGCLSAPVEEPGKLQLSLQAVNRGFGREASQKIEALSGAASQMVFAINGLVNVAGESIKPAYDTFNEGLTKITKSSSDGLDTINKTVSDGIKTAKNQWESAKKQLADQYQAAESVVGSQVKGLAEQGTAQAQILADQYQAAESAVSSQVKSLAEQGTAQAQKIADKYQAAESAVSSQVKSLAEQGTAQAKEIADSISSAANAKITSVQTALPSAGLFDDRPRKIEQAILEQEDVLSQKQTIKDNFSGFLSNIFQPQPLVDTITEEEKYGNTGDKFASVGKALVGTTESLSKFFSNAINIPFDVVKSVTRSASNKLNNFGAKLIGL